MNFFEQRIPIWFYIFSWKKTLLVQLVFFDYDLLSFFENQFPHDSKYFELFEPLAGGRHMLFADCSYLTYAFDRYLRYWLFYLINKNYSQDTATSNFCFPILAIQNVNGMGF